ncbi:efflux RND transporter periplasmic adaptor subunit [Desulforegula conservatrix]|uniref:efflux RND transporter periplasmic adaptor subunit n=1 Tax=Desulforegula conservatrix TaxID=153026 RepID=UPI00040AE7A7|nr:efflux RND transporter periplasmic adaptor subunit [Desulforegula conservatrix]
MKKWIIVSGAALLLFAAIGVKYMAKQKNSEEKAGDSSDLVAVDTAKPEKKDLQRFVEVYGSLAPKTSTEVKSEIPGRVAEIRVKEWDSVTPQDILLELDPTDFKVELNRNEAGLQMAKAQHLEAKAGLNRAMREWERTMKLKEAGLVTGQEVDERKSELESAEARANLAEAQIGQAQAMVAESKRNMSKTKVYAPITGAVSERKVDKGDWVDRGAPLFAVVDNRILDLTANVPATEFPKVREGQNLVFSVDGLPGQTFTGSVKRLNPLVSSSDRSGRIQAEVSNAEGKLRGGIFARGKIVIEEKKQALTVPKNALLSFNIEKGTASVFVIKSPDTAVLKNVATGLATEETIEITSGINDNDDIVIRGGFNLKDGTKVTVTNSRQQAEPAAADKAGKGNSTQEKK